MKLEWRSLVSLKAPVIILFVVFWNAGFMLAMYLGGGGLLGGLTPIGMKVTGFVCLSACIFSLAVATIKPLQLALIAPSRAKCFNPKEFYFLAFVSGFFAISRLVFPVVEPGVNAF